MKIKYVDPNNMSYKPYFWEGNRGINYLGIEAKVKIINRNNALLAIKNLLKKEDYMWAHGKAGDDMKIGKIKKAERRENNHGYYDRLIAEFNEIELTEVEKKVFEINEKDYYKAHDLLMNIAKSTTRQSFWEKAITQYISLHNMIVSAQKVKGHLYWIDGKKFRCSNRNQLPKGYTKQKSTDIFAKLKQEGNELLIYIFHKYTKNSGGSADHDMAESEGWLEDVAKVKSKNSIFIMIGDGGFFTKEKLQYLSKFEQPNVKITNHKEIYKVLSRIANDK